MNKQTKNIDDIYKGVKEKCEKQDRINGFKDMYNMFLELREAGFTESQAMMFIAIIGNVGNLFNS